MSYQEKTTGQPDSRLSAALLEALKPLARILVLGGIDHRTFDEIFKRAMVEVASERHGIRGRPTNTSRVAAMTGLSRRQVKKIREVEHKCQLPPVPRKNIPAEVLHYWYTDPEFLDEKGKPRSLQYSKGYPSFRSLVAKAGGDIPAGAIRTELVRVGAVEIDHQGFIRAQKRSFIPAETDAMIVEGLSFGLRRLTETIAFNAEKSAVGSPKRRFQRVIQNADVEESAVEEITYYLSNILESLSFEMDDKLGSFVRRSDDESTTKSAGKTIGIGIYLYQD